MSVTIFPAKLVFPSVVVALPNGRLYTREYEIIGQVEMPQWSDHDKRWATWTDESQNINFNRGNAYKVFLALGIIKENGNVDEIPPLKATDVLFRCIKLLHRPVQATEFSNAQDPIMNAVAKTLIGDGSATLIDCSQDDSDALLDRVRRLKSFCEWTIGEVGSADLALIIPE